MAAMLQPQIILLKEGTDTTQGKAQLVSNINACTATADVVRTTLGPRGMDKLIHDNKGTVTISNDGATIMKLLDIVHPAAKILVDIAKSQDSEVGDGTTTVVLLAGEFLKEAKPFIEDGVHPQNLIRSYRTACYLALEKVKELAVSIEGKSLEEKKSLLAKCATTTLSSKLIGGEKEFFASMVVDAVIAIGYEDRLNMIGIKKVPGGNMRDSFLVNGVAFKKTFSYAGFEQQPKKFVNPKILLLNIELELKSEKENAEIRLSDPSQYQSIVDAEWNIIYDKLDKCVQSGAKVVLSRLAIGDLATQYFADRDIFCAGRVTEEDLQRVAAARKLSEQRFMPVWNFCNFFILKESLAFMFEMAHLFEDALREYDELELCYIETVNMIGKQRDFGGVDRGDDQAVLLNPGNKPLTQIVQDDSFREFEFRQYLFACQSKLLFKLNRAFEVASRGYSFIISFSKALALHENILPFCMREVWVITACLDVVNATASHYIDGLVAPDIEKEFYRLQGDLYSLCRIKFMRLSYLIGYGTEIERSPVNSASLSMLPWPKPAIWPSVPPDALSEVFTKEKMILQETHRVKHFGIQRKPLPLEPSVLLREANRRRASLSAGNMFEMFEGRPVFNEGSGSEASTKMSPSQKVRSSAMSRTNSSPGNFESSIDRPMRLAEIYIAAEHALQHTISNPSLRKSLSSLEEFEQKYLELTKGAADNYHRSWWKRHGVVLDGEIAAVCFKHRNIDLAAKSYEKVCALYAGEGWQDLLAEVLPNLAECQKILNDEAGYLSSCVRLLSLDKGLFSSKERQAFQLEVVNLAHSEMKNPVPLDVSSLITFSGNPGPPLELCDGDPGTLSVTVWSGFPDDITLDSLSLTLMATSNGDEGVKALRSTSATVLEPGRNNITLDLPPQKPGSYVLGVLTGQIGHLRFRSHSFSKGAPVDSDDFMIYEKPTRPILKVFKPRALVDLASAISSALLINEPQWVGIIVRPMDYSLKDAVLQIDTGPGLAIEKSHVIEMESYADVSQSAADVGKSDAAHKNGSLAIDKHFEQLRLHDGRIVFPGWANNVTSVLWIPIRAISDRLARGSSSVSPQRQSIVDGMRTIALKLEFGVSHNQIFERTLAVHFTDPFHVNTRIADKCNDGTLLLQVILQSEVKATLTIYDAWLDLQDGFAHTRKGDGKPNPGFIPLVISPNSRAGILFSICFDMSNAEEEAKAPQPDSILNIRYGISGDRTIGAHPPAVESPGPEVVRQDLIFRSALVLKRPVLDPCLAVGFLPLPSGGLRVGQLVNMKWRVERLKDLEENEVLKDDDEVLYEVNANSDNWMIAGRKRGHASLSMKQGSRIVITILCVPLVAGYVRPPQLGLPDVDEANISCNPAGPHLVCVLPPALSSSFCIPA